MEQIRCAIYCRKSVEKGLDMEFNSLDAQRDAGEAYIASQAANGWVCLPEHYDDGGFSGGNMNRPALKQLLKDCEAGKVDVIVVYKIDRLSRSLFDFAELSKLFEKWNVAFVSVTQEINTHTSTGRMMLNILMTFAQFEREMIATRIKDKMAATRKRGKWCGGQKPYGYCVVDKKLVVEPEKVPIVRRIFDRYLEIQSPKQIAKELNTDGIKTVTNKNWDRQRVYSVLNNHAYIGEVFYEGKVYPGEHEAIIERATWDTTRRFLQANKRERAMPFHIDDALHGLIRCGHCNGSMMPTSSRRWGRVYRYYTCLRDKEALASTCPIKSVPAGEIENLVISHMTPILQAPEVIAGVRQQTGLKETRIADFLKSDLTSILTPIERKRLMQLLVDHVTVNEDTINIEFRTENIKSIQEIYRDQNP